MYVCMHACIYIYISISISVMYNYLHISHIYIYLYLCVFMYEQYVALWNAGDDWSLRKSWKSWKVLEGLGVWRLLSLRPPLLKWLVLQVLRLKRFSDFQCPLSVPLMYRSSMM